MDWQTKRIIFEHSPGLTKEILALTDKMVLVKNDILQGTQISAHSHDESQLIVYIIEGILVLNINGIERSFSRGDIAIIPEGIKHWGIAVQKSLVLDYFTPPPRELMDRIKNFKMDQEST